MSKTVELDIPKSAKTRELRRMASEFAKDSIVTDALSRLIEQVIETAAEHAKEAQAKRIAGLEAFANEVISRFGKAGIPGHELATLARAALKQD